MRSRYYSSSVDHPCHHHYLSRHHYHDHLAVSRHWSSWNKLKLFRNLTEKLLRLRDTSTNQGDLSPISRWLGWFGDLILRLFNWFANVSLPPKLRWWIIIKYWKSSNISQLCRHQCVEADVEVGEPSLLQGGQPPGEGHAVCCHSNRLQTVGSHFHIIVRHIWQFFWITWESLEKTSSPEVQEERQVSPRWRRPLLSQEAPLLSTGSENWNS